MDFKLIGLAGFLFAASFVAAQPPDDEYYPFAEREERVRMLATDSVLFYRAVQAPSDAYGAAVDFNLPQVALKRRGQPNGRECMATEGVRIGFRYASALRLLGAGEEMQAGLASSPDAVGSTGGVCRLSFSTDEALMPYRASVHFTDRNYLAAAKFAWAGSVGNGWRLAAATDLRTGRDMHVEGVFTNAFTVAFRASKLWSSGRSLALALVVPPSERGTRLSSAEEAFTLTGDRLYNPAWGFQNGKVRNSRVRREAVPLAVAAWRMPLSVATSFAATAAVETGIRKYSALGWYDARTPMPDNYRYLPSYTHDRATEEAWRRGDARYTQIRWDELIAQNRMTDGTAAYALEDRVERICNLRFVAGFTTGIESRVTLRYGLYLDREAIRNYKQMRDLLGGSRIVDIDQFLVDDDTYGNLLQNDLRHPNRSIGKGDRFGYDYSLSKCETGVRLRAEYRADRLRADLDLTFGTAAVRRRGHYEKELFSGDRSFGPSRRMRFTPFTFKLLAGYAFSPRSYLEVCALAAAVVPDAADLFYQPLYNNRTVDAAGPGRIYAAELNYRLTGPVLRLQITAFVTGVFDRTETRRYYDDMAGVYCNMAAANIATASYGLEAAAEIRLSYRWHLSLAASAGRSEYVRNPLITVLSDVDNTAVDVRATSYMGGCVTGGAPQITGFAGVGYFGPKGWGFRISAGYAGVRYVEPAFVRRTARVARQGGVTREAFEAFTRQERLGDAFTLDAALFKTFYFDRSRLTAALMLRNLTGKQPVYDGYESLRVRRIRSGAQTLWEPQATRYTYAYPRSFYLTVSYRF